MDSSERWKEIVASSLDWDQAHLSLQNAVDGIPAELRGRRPQGLPHSPWELVEHIRIAQHDLFDFCTNPEYEHKLNWPDDYWPVARQSISDEDWDNSLTEIRKHRDALKELTTRPGFDLTDKIPMGTGQTYLRTILVAVDHASYHTGELLAVRRLLGAWPGA